MSRLIRWIAVGLTACLAIAAASAVSGTSARAKEDDNLRIDPVLDLVAQIPASDDSPAIVTLSIADVDASADAVLRIRLHEPVRTREELWAAATGPAPTPESSSWVVQDWKADGDGAKTVVAVPIAPPDEPADGDEAGPASSGPLPLHIELSNVDGTPIDTLRTFLMPAAADAASPDEDLAVAVVVDLRLPPAHSPDGGATFDQAFLDRVLETAQVLVDHSGIPLTVHLSGETLDALALIGDDESLSILRAAVDGRQLLVSPWTSLDIDDWIAAGRADVVVNGLDRATDALDWAGLEASTVMRFDGMPSPAAASLVTDSAPGITGFVGGRVFSTPLVPPDPVTVVVDAAGVGHPTAQADPLLEVALRNHDPELAVQWALAEFARIGRGSDEPTAVVVVVSALIVDWDPYSRDTGGSSRPFLIPGTEPAAIGLLLEGLDAHSSLKPVTVDSLLAATAPVGTVSGAGLTRPDDPSFSLYLAERTGVEERLHAYESLLDGDRASTLTAPLHTLMAASANQYLTTDRRRGLIEAVDRAVVRGAAGVEFVERGRISIIERRVDLPVTLISNHTAAVTVALKLSSENIRFPEGDRLVFGLEPGRNDLPVPIEATEPGAATIAVAVTTPDEAGIITLSSGTLKVRYAQADGLGTLILVVLGAVLAAWWLQALRRRSHSTGAAGGTVASSAPGRGSSTSNDTRT